MSSPTESSYVNESIPFPALSDETVRLILDRTNAAEQMIRLMKGEVWVVRKDEDGNPVGAWESRGDKMMNDEGIKTFTLLIYSTVTPDKLVTNISEDEVNRLVREMMSAVVDLVWERGDEFEIPAANRSYLIRLLEQNLFLSLSASRKGTLIKALRNQISRDEKVTYTPERQQPRFKLPFTQ